MTKPVEELEKELAIERGRVAKLQERVETQRELYLARVEAKQDGTYQIARWQREIVNMRRVMSKYVDFGWKERARRLEIQHENNQLRKNNERLTKQVQSLQSQLENHNETNTRYIEDVVS